MTSIRHDSTMQALRRNTAMTLKWYREYLKEDTSNRIKDRNLAQIQRTISILEWTAEDTGDFRSKLQAARLQAVCLRRYVRSIRRKVGV